MSNARYQEWKFDHTFVFSKDLKNDIVYCQRALKAHIKVHQMVLEVFENQQDADPVQKKNVLAELESEIFEINAEQNYLFLRLRRAISDYTTTLKDKGVAFDEPTINMLVSMEIVPLVNNGNIRIIPSSVMPRKSEGKLIEMYFEEKNCYEILDSDEESQQQLNQKPPQQHQQQGAAASQQRRKQQHQQKYKSSADQTLLTDIKNYAGSSKLNGHAAENTQMSLLKPKTQRNVNGNNEATEAGYIDASQFLQIGLTCDNNQAPAPHNNMVTKQAQKRSSAAAAVAATASTAKTDEIMLPASSNVTKCRLNLRQVLKRAQTKAAGNLGVATAATENAATLTDNKSSYSLMQAKKSVNQLQTTAAAATKKQNTKAKSMRQAKAEHFTSSSDDSNLEAPANGASAWPDECGETRTSLAEYEQLEFMQMFGLTTHQHIQELGKRHSKRRRRTLYHNSGNSNKNFAYAREYKNQETNPPPQKRKDKSFLLAAQSKRSKPNSAETEKQSAESTPSRSSSSSPDEKRGCNECLKGGGCFEQCLDCRGFYHQSCHREVNEKQNPFGASSLKAYDKIIDQLCPACVRVQMHLKRKEEKLKDTAKRLDSSYIIQRTRQAQLNRESNYYKIKMSKLFKIVKTMK